VDFSMMRVSDIVLVSDDGRIVEGEHTMINGAAYSIHSTIHRLRPDVNAAAHSHSKFTTTYRNRP